MDAAEFAQVGAELVELGYRLNELKTERTRVEAEIAELEAKIRPLVVQHSQFVAQLIGAPAPSVALVSPTTPEQRPDMTLIERRVRHFLQSAEPGLSVHEIAAELKLDPVLVRQVMVELFRKSQTPDAATPG
jgi:hypothetical protein